MKAVKNYVLGIPGDSQGNVHIFGSYSVCHCDRTVQINMCYSLKLTEKKVFEYTDKNILRMAELK
jgi:hypothetical protein